MTDYKLVPVEPTPEMLEAGEYAQYTGCYVSGIYADMLAAAPAVQGEPVGAAQQPCPESIREGAPYDDPAFESLCREHEIWGTAAAAQCAVFWEAGKRVAEQQPAPDVPGLTEALRQYQHNDGSGLVFGYDRLLVDQYVAGLVQQRHRDSAELRRLCQARDEQRDGRLAALERAAKAEADVAQLAEALEQIERWDGFPSTDEVWEGSGEPVSYGAAFGSNGERDFMREVARKALAAHRKGGDQQ